MTTQRSPGLFRRLAHGSLVKQILVGLVLGILLAWISKPAAEAVGLLGTLFVGALKAVAPIPVLMLVMASIANHQHGQKTNIRPILFLYLLGTFSAALAAVVFSFAFPSTLHLSSSAGDISPPSGIVEVMRGLVMSMVSNPIDALLKGNYIGILVWAIGLGFALRHGNETTKNPVNDMSNAVTFMVKLVIRFAPIGIFGLVSSTRQPPVSPHCGATRNCWSCWLAVCYWWRWWLTHCWCGGKFVVTRSRWCCCACAKAACMPSSPAALRRTFR